MIHNSKILSDIEDKLLSTNIREAVIINFIDIFITN